MPFGQQLVACVVILLVTTSVGADEELRGPAFTDPDKQVAMPEEWRNRPLQYQAWAEGAALAVTLDQHLYPALLPFVQQFARERNVDIAVQEGTCGISAGTLQERQADIGGFCCPPGESDRMPGLRWHTVGIAPLALLVSTDNPVDSIGFAQAQKVFQGQVYRWSEVAPEGAKRPIHPVSRLHCKARPGHWRLLLDHQDLFGARVAEVSSISDMMEWVASDRDAIGYEVLWNIPHHRTEGKVKALRIDGVAPTDSDALVAGRYPLYRTYNLTTWSAEPAANPLAGELVAWLKGRIAELDPEFGMIPAETLRKAGWRFQGAELTGEPPS